MLRKRAEWLNQLQGWLRRNGQRAAVVGLGQEWGGDDAAGLQVARTMLRAKSLAGSAWLVVDAGSAPENCLGALRRHKPDLLLLVDAAEMGESPGAVRLLDWKAATGLSASTHTLP